MEGLTPGRVVHYVMPDGRYEGEHRPAIVLKVWGNSEPACVQLAVFVDGTNDYPNFEVDRATGAMSVLWRTSVVCDREEKKPGTWHWIERA